MKHFPPLEIPARAMMMTFRRLIVGGACHLRTVFAGAAEYIGKTR
jgi:hypothetical protein